MINTFKIGDYMQSIMLILKGFVIGIGKIVPGVSGSLIAFLLGIYEKAIDSVTNFFSDIKNNILFLSKVGLGVVLSIILLSRIIIIMLNNYYSYTLALFIGLICGTVPFVLKKVKITKKKNTVYIFLAILLTISLNNLKTNNVYIPSNTIFDYLYIGIIGFIDALTMIIPGISGTATFMMLGCYNFVLKIFSNPFFSITYSLLFGIGLLIGIIVVSKFVSYMLNRFPEQFFLIIVGFLFSSIICLVINITDFININNIIPIIILYFCGFVGSYKLGQL